MGVLPGCLDGGAKDAFLFLDIGGVRG
jgi:hypothetical protein